MPTELIAMVLVVAVAFGLGGLGGWALRGAIARRQHTAWAKTVNSSHEALADDQHQAALRVHEVEQELIEIAAAYRQLHEVSEGQSRQLDAARLHVQGLEDELAVQQRSAQVAREELGTARRRIGHLEGDLRSMQVIAGRAMNEDRG